MGTRWNCLAEAVLTSTHNLRFEQKYENIRIIFPENFQFLEVKFSIYLNRCVFVMERLGTTSQNKWPNGKIKIMLCVRCPIFFGAFYVTQYRPIISTMQMLVLTCPTVGNAF